MGKITYARKLTIGIIVLATTAVLLTTILVTSGLFFHTEQHIKRDLIADANTIIAEHLTIVESSIRQKSSEGELSLGSVLRNKDLSAVIVDSSGVVLARYGVYRDMDDQDIRIEQVDSGKYMDMIIKDYGLSDTYTVPIKAGSDIFGYMRIVRKNREIQIMKDTFGIVITLGFTLSWALSLIFSYSIVKRISEPLTKLSRHLEKLKPDNMIPIAESPQMDRELSVVVSSINNMILRLRDNLKRERQITENISHEFKTPLTRIASNLQVGKVKEAEREVLELGGNVDALLSLAIWDQHTERTDAAIVLKHLTRLIPSRIVVEINLPKKIMTPLPHSHLQIIFRNLIDNAIKHNQKNGQIKITGKAEKDKWKVTIQNTTSNDVLKSKMVERKYRKGESAGHGIGMSIVADMCRMHGLKMEAKKDKKLMSITISG